MKESLTPYAPPASPPQGRMDSDIPLSELGPILTTAGKQVAAQKYAIIACYAIFLYDYFLTLNDEIIYIWRRQFSLVTFAYTFTLQVIANFSTIDTAVCMRFIPWQAFAEGTPLTVVTNLIIGLRVYALYRRNIYIAVMLTAYVLAELVSSLWEYLVPSIHPVTLPGPPDVGKIPALHLCLVSTSDRITNFQSAVFPFMQAIFDSVAFGLIVYKTVDAIIKERALVGARVLIMKHGILYYAVVFSAYVTWAIMIVFSPPGLKYAAAAPSVIMTCVSVNRLTLSLRAFYEIREFETADDTHVTTIDIGRRGLKRRRSWIGTSTFELTKDSQFFSSSESRSDSQENQCPGGFELRNLRSRPEASSVMGGRDG
ncbi:hypothetical protein SCHPADRAFT_937534 [Schizopora paradoxa]|uniref:DUF6533 domain-containing protein n=1 Tax=Schizopora paradoxa TaxID=27342 RepID=A0A0H2SI91_9AGAM|nr:hypothetical protein SCHPADRAFT_937534 [Schizopora paradoxa]